MSAAKQAPKAPRPAGDERVRGSGVEQGFSPPSQDVGGGLVPPLQPLDHRVDAFLAGRGQESSRVEALAGDASTRRYFRITGGGKSTVLALYPEPFAAERSDFVLLRELLAGYSLPVPAILEIDGPRGIVLLQDLGDECLQDVVATHPGEQVRDHYRAAVAQLVRLQGQARRGPQTAPCFRLAFDIEKLSFELNFFREHFLGGERRRQLSTADGSELAEAFHQLSAELAGWPRVLCHRDFHSRNLMVHRGSLVWIDFQDARLGPATYDLVSLLRDSYVDLHEDLVTELCEEFRALAAPGDGRDAFTRRFELTAVQRNLKALGTFGYMHTVRGKDVYLAHVPRTLAHLRRNLSRHPELSALRRVLARHLPELE